MFHLGINEGHRINNAISPTLISGVNRSNELYQILVYNNDTYHDECGGAMFYHQEIT